MTKEEVEATLEKLNQLKQAQTEIDFKIRSCNDRLAQIQDELAKMGYNSTEEVAEAYVNMTEELSKAQDEINALLDEVTAQT